MTDLAYEYLPADEQRSNIENRLLALEREHQLAVLDVDTAGTNVTDDVIARRDSIETRIKALRTRHSAVKDPAKANS